ncbi:MAG: hypothetical protein A2073_00920 [Deltaproteobacteria bacterium GWC2_42_11]|nr:MAG: hypothetical protein A2073_00920 [Deltaproteobacteria bacterium GWC2_42_11]HBO83518.1 hypothetical protein [Deltaproteobacteria bacterium]
MQEEQELIKRLKNGDEEAFIKIVDMYREAGTSLAYRITDDYHEAEDVSQEAFAILYKKIHSFRNESSLKTFFMSILINVARQRARRKRILSFISLSHTSDLEEGQIDIKDDCRAEQHVIGKEIKDKIERAMNYLPVRQKEVFVMRHYEGMSLAEIAGITGCSVGTVKSHLFRAIGSLRKKLGGLWNEVR